MGSAPSVPYYAFTQAHPIHSPTPLLPWAQPTAPLPPVSQPSRRPHASESPRRRSGGTETNQTVQGCCTASVSATVPTASSAGNHHYSRRSLGHPWRPPPLRHLLLPTPPSPPVSRFVRSTSPATPVHSRDKLFLRPTPRTMPLSPSLSPPPNATAAAALPLLLLLVCASSIAAQPLASSQR